MAKPKQNVSSWFDEETSQPIIAQQAQRLEGFLAALADGRIDDAELQSQERRLVALMKEVEPLLSPALHEKVTQLLCELTAYDLMQTMNALGEARPKSVFQG